MDFESLGLLGAPFEPVETYVYYEGRRTFAMRSKTWPDLYYIVNTVDEDENTGDLTTVAVAMYGERFRAVRSGRVKFRDAFSAAAPGTLWVVRWRYGDDDVARADIQPMEPLQFPTQWLPSPDVGLDLPTDTVKRFERNALISIADAQARSVFAVEIESAGARITEFPTRYAGELQIALDGEVVALAKQETAGKKSNAGKEIRTAVLELQAASFVLVLAVDTPGALVEPTEVTDVVFDKLNALVESVASGDATTFLTELKKHNPTVRNRFKDMLRPLSVVGSGIALSTVLAHAQTVKVASASPDAVRAAVDAIDAVEPDVTHVDVKRGILTGLVLRTQRFEVVDLASGATYKGYMTDPATEEANGLSVGDHSFIKARIRIEIPFTNDDDDTTGIKHVLESVSAISADETPDDNSADATQ